MDPSHNETPAASGPPDSPAPTKYGTKGLEQFLAANRGRWTDEALAAQAAAAGWEPEVVSAAMARVIANEQSQPLRRRARTFITAIYLLGLVLLLGGMAINPSAAAYGGNVIGSIVLVISMGIAYLLARFWLSRKSVSSTLSRADLAVLVSLPAILWLVVTGICVATGLPIPRTV